MGLGIETAALLVALKHREKVKVAPSKILAGGTPSRIIENMSPSTVSQGSPRKIVSGWEYWLLYSMDKNWSCADVERFETRTIVRNQPHKPVQSSSCPKHSLTSLPRKACSNVKRPGNLQHREPQPHSTVRPIPSLPHSSASPPNLRHQTCHPNQQALSKSRYVVVFNMTLRPHQQESRPCSEQVIGAATPVSVSLSPGSTGLQRLPPLPPPSHASPSSSLVLLSNMPVSRSTADVGEQIDTSMADIQPSPLTNPAALAQLSHATFPVASPEPSPPILKGKERERALSPPPASRASEDSIPTLIFTVGDVEGKWDDLPVPEGKLDVCLIAGDVTGSSLQEVNTSFIPELSFDRFPICPARRWVRFPQAPLHLNDPQKPFETGEVENADQRCVQEFEALFRWLDQLDVTLKVVIAGNHDWALSESPQEQERGVNLGIHRHQGQKGQLAVRKNVLSRFAMKKIVFLEEGSHSFVLENGAKMEVYASPYTPDRSKSAPGFRFKREGGHK